MKNRARFAVKTLLLCTLICQPGCQQPSGAGSPFVMDPAIPHKRLLTNSAPVEAICYVDTERNNPLNAKDYVFAASADAPETSFFNYVVLSYAYLSMDSRGYIHLELSPALKQVLDNGERYIKPLRQKGIQALVEVRSGIYSETENGQGLGLGTMDMAAIDEFTKELKLLADQYGINGFDFNDTGGGRKAYPPLTRELRQFRSNRPLYEESKFEDADGKPLGPAEIETVLWREGGSNFSNLIQRANEKLKENYSMIYKNGGVETVETRQIKRSIMAHNSGHGGFLLAQLRMAYMPDAYSGADPKVTGNLNYIVHDVPYNDSRPHASLWDEARNTDLGADFDNQYVPITVDLLNKKDAGTARRWARTFLLVNPDGSQTDANNQNRYGALFCINLPPASVSNSAEYLSYFSRILFGRTTRLADQPGAGDYKLIR